MHGVLEQDREVGAGLGESGSHHVHLAHAGGLDASAIKRGAGNVEQLVATERVGGIDANHFALAITQASAGQHGLDHRRTHLVGLVFDGLDHGMRTDRHGRRRILGQVGEQLRAGGFDSDRRVGQDRGLQVRHAFTAGERLEECQDFGIHVFGTGERRSGRGRRGDFRHGDLLMSGSGCCRG